MTATLELDRDQDRDQERQEPSMASKRGPRPAPPGDDYPPDGPMDVVDKIDWIIRSTPKMTATSLSRNIRGGRSSYISDLIRLRNRPEDETIIDIADVLGLDLEWLSDDRIGWPPIAADGSEWTPDGLPDTLFRTYRGAPVGSEGAKKPGKKAAKPRPILRREHEDRDREQARDQTRDQSRDQPRQQPREQDHDEPRDEPPIGPAGRRKLPARRPSWGYHEPTRRPSIRPIVPSSGQQPLRPNRPAPPIPLRPDAPSVVPPLAREPIDREPLAREPRDYRAARDAESRLAAQVSDVPEPLVSPDAGLEILGRESRREPPMADRHSRWAALTDAERKILALAHEISRGDLTLEMARMRLLNLD